MATNVMRLYEPDSDDDSLGGDLSKDDGCHFTNYWSERYVDPKADLFPDTSVYDNCGKFDDTMDLGSDDEFIPPTDPKKHPMHVSEDDAHSLGSDKDFDAIEFADKHFAPNAMNLPKEDDLEDYLGGGGEEDNEDEVITPTTTEGESKKLIAGALKAVRSGKDKGIHLPSDERADIGMTEVSFRNLTPSLKTNVVSTTHTPGEITAQDEDHIGGIFENDEARIVRSRKALSRALKSAKTEEQIEMVQEKALSEIDSVMIDVNKFLKKMGRRIQLSPAFLPAYRNFAARYAKLQQTIDEGLNMKQIEKAAEESLRMETQVLNIIKQMKKGMEKKPTTATPAKEVKATPARLENKKSAESDSGEESLDEESAPPSPEPIVEIPGDFDPEKERREFQLGFRGGEMGVVEGIPQGYGKRWSFKLNRDALKYTSPTLMIERAIEVIKDLPETMVKRFAMKKLKAMLHNGQIHRGEKEKKAKRGRHVKAASGGAGSADSTSAASSGAGRADSTSAASSGAGRMPKLLPESDVY
jgi:hypothetical protein